MLVASCPSASVAQELGRQLFASLVWKDPAELILDRDLKTMRNEIVAAKCTVAAAPKQIDPWTGPETDRYEISAVAKPSLHLAVIDTKFSNRDRRMHFVAIGVRGFYPAGASDA